MLGKFGKATTFLILITPTIASAQLSDFPMSPIQYPSAMSTTPLINVSSTNETIRTPVEGQRVTNATVQPSSLSYRPSAARRKANLTNFANRMRAQDPQGAAQLQQIIASTDLIGQLDQAMRAVGLSANNVADCYTVYWIAAWETKHNRDMGSSKTMYQAVKAQATQAMANTRQIQSASDATKQEAAEALLLQAALIASAKEVFQGNKQQMLLLARAVDQGARSTGLDLSSMTLTQDGFVPRSGGRSDASEAAGDDSQLAANDDGAQTEGANMGDYALYAVAGTGLLAGMFALGKGFSKKG